MSVLPRVLVVDDSAVVRQVLGGIIEASPHLELMACAADPIQARALMTQQWPDVIILDLEMPHMDGITFLRQLMAERPTPVLICSSLALTGAAVTLQALAAGAVGFMTKPALGVKGFLSEAAGELVQQVRQAALAHPRAGASAAAPRVGGARPLVGGAARRLVLVGASTGGTQALEQILTALPGDCPGMVIVQHMPAGFTAMFAERLDGLCAPRVREAQDGDLVCDGQVLVAPGGLHTRLRWQGQECRVEVKPGPPVRQHRPSVDVLFRSALSGAGAGLLAVILTGMGDDGAQGMRELYQAGAFTVAQDEASCVVYGMPAEARRAGGVQFVVPLAQMAAAITAFGAASGPFAAA